MHAIVHTRSAARRRRRRAAARAPRRARLRPESRPGAEFIEPCSRLCRQASVVSRSCTVSYMSHIASTILASSAGDISVMRLIATLAPLSAARALAGESGGGGVTIHDFQHVPKFHSVTFRRQPDQIFWIDTHQGIAVERSQLFDLTRDLTASSSYFVQLGGRSDCMSAMMFLSVSYEGDV